MDARAVFVHRGKLNAVARFDDGLIAIQANQLRVPLSARRLAFNPSLVGDAGKRGWGQDRKSDCALTHEVDERGVLFECGLDLRQEGDAHLFAVAELQVECLQFGVAYSHLGRAAFPHDVVPLKFAAELDLQAFKTISTPPSAGSRWPFG